MQELKVLGVENGYIVVSTPSGERYGVPIDEVLPLGLKQPSSESAVRKLSPREIQTHIRAGMSAADVAKITGVPLDYIQRFEGPVLAEREFMVESALNVPVHLAIDSDPAESATFGAVIRDRLQSIGATEERWASWKEQGGGWIVKLSFTADTIERDARWSFEPRSQALAPLNQEATTLSQQGDLAAAMIPRLRAVGVDEKPVDASRFDSGAFVVEERDDFEQIPQRETVPIRPVRQPVAEAAITREVPVQQAPSQTADLLEALRRRRGERESAQYDLDGGTPSAAHPASGAIRVIEMPTAQATPPQPKAHTPESPAEHKDQPTASTEHPSGPVPVGAQGGSRRQRRGRQPMPSWDEIVFGSKNDDDHS
ncbi:septation protein SepH [Desertivibrio insolitus]|uniref:septation protein SepH n=1 Tax=Herbiconiux sp. SYSU D00978 TaxID=2812562 RepID=UPI001A96EF77|nr:septation protein SepH [Herbiconiux sp. SYSU D00978]